jgi:hypothetical protein
MARFSGKLVDDLGNSIDGVEGEYIVAEGGKSWQGRFSLPIGHPGSGHLMAMGAYLLEMDDGHAYPIGITKFNPMAARNQIEIAFMGRGAPVPKQ